MSKVAVMNTVPSPSAMAETACRRKTLGQGFQDGFQAGVVAERSRRGLQWVPVNESTWVAASEGCRYFRAWQRPKDSGPDGGLFIVTETGNDGTAIRRIAEDLPSWKAVNDAVVAVVKAAK